MNLKISHPIIIFWLSIIIFYGLNDASSSQSVFPTNEVSWLPASEYRSYHDISKDWNYSNNLLNKPISITLPYEFPVNTITVITKNIKIDSVNTNRQFSLLAYGIQIRCRVFVNKTFIGSHKGGSTSFEFSIPRHILLFNRDNEVTIEIDSPLGSPDEIPVRIRPYGIPPVSGALFQNIFLVTSPEFGFQQIDASYDIDGLLSSGIVHLKFKMRNPFKSDSNHTVTQTHRITATAELWAPDDNVPVARCDPEEISLQERPWCEGQVNLSVHSIHVWSANDPFLYETRLFLYEDKEILDQYVFHIGFKKITINGEKLEINNQQTKMIIVDWYDDIYMKKISGDSLYNLFEKDIIRIKHMGANCIRIVGGQPHPAILSLCDQMGLYVLEEIPLYYVPSGILTRDAFLQSVETSLIEQIRRDKNHASILAWGFGHGFNPCSKGTQMFISHLAAEVSNHDSRPVYGGVQGKGALVDFLPVDFEILDHVYPELAITEDTFLDKNHPALIFRLGSECTPFTLYTKNKLKAEEKQAFALKQSMSCVLKQAWLAGVDINAWRDWAGDYPHLIFGPRDGANLYVTGIVDRDNFERLVYTSVQNVILGNQSKVADVQTTEHKSEIFPIIGLLLLIMFLFLYRRDRTFRNYLQRIFLHPHGFYVDRRDNRRIDSFYSLIVGFIVNITLAVIISSILYSLRENDYFAQMLSVLIPDSRMAFRFILLVWNPLGAILTISLFIFLAGLGICIYLKCVSLLVKRRLRFNQIFLSMQWILAHFLFLLPLSIITYRAITSANIEKIFLIIFIIFLVWSIFRIFHATRILMSLPFNQTFLVLAISMILITGTFGMFLQRTRAFWDYFEYFVHMLI